MQNWPPLQVILRWQLQQLFEGLPLLVLIRVIMDPTLQVLLPAGYFDPIITRVVIIATVGGIPNVLMDGLVTRQEITPSNEPGQSTLTVTGEDLSVAMGLIQKVVPFPGMPVVVQVNAALLPYALLGIVPVVIPPFITVTDLPTNAWRYARGRGVAA